MPKTTPSKQVELALMVEAPRMRLLADFRNDLAVAEARVRQAYGEDADGFLADLLRRVDMTEAQAEKWDAVGRGRSWAVRMLTECVPTHGTPEAWRALVLRWERALEELQRAEERELQFSKLNQ